MYALIGLAAFVALIAVAGLRGWGSDTRDPDFNLAVSAYGRPTHGHTRHLRHSLHA
jgi:hypothetical protein